MVTFDCMTKVGVIPLPDLSNLPYCIKKITKTIEYGKIFTYIWRRAGVGSILCINGVIAKEIKNCTCYAALCDINCMRRRMPLPKTGATH